MATSFQLQVHLEGHHHPNPEDPQAETGKSKNSFIAVFQSENLIIALYI
jgi:hypothetical protein